MFQGSGRQLDGVAGMSYGKTNSQWRQGVEEAHDAPGDICKQDIDGESQPEGVDSVTTRQPETAPGRQNGSPDQADKLLPEAFRPFQAISQHGLEGDIYQLVIHEKRSAAGFQPSASILPRMAESRLLYL